MPNDRIMVTKVKIDRIGNAIREKAGSSDTYTLDEMPEAIRSIETGGGGGEGGYAPNDVSDIILTKEVNDVISIKWSDPADETYDDKPISEWGGTLIVRNENNIPQTIEDGVRVVDNKVRDAYKTTAFEDDDADVDKIYFYRFFVYTNSGIYLRGSVRMFKPNITWANGTDAQICAVVHLADIGVLDLYEDLGWRVGDERQVELSAIATSGEFDGVSWNVSESHAAQTVTLVLMDTDHYDLAIPTKARTKCNFVVGVKDVLGASIENGETGSMDVTTRGWSGSYRRPWCNAGFRSSIPSTLRPIFKQFKVKHSINYDYNSGVTESIDYFTFPSEGELITVRYNSVPSEFNAVSQLEYYKNSSNREKRAAGSFAQYFTRSVMAGNSIYWVYMKTINDTNYGERFKALSPMGVI